MNLLPAFVGAPVVNGVYNVDALTLLRALPTGSVDLIATDPPFNIDKAAWDSWATLDDFLAWLDMHLVEFKRVLKSNGSLYLFAATRYQASVELAVGRHFNVLSNIRWRKPAYSTKAEMNDKEDQRTYFPSSETIIFAEQYGSDKQASDLAGYETMCQAACARIFQVADLSVKQNVSRADIGALIASEYKNIESAKAQASNWILGKNVPNLGDFKKLKTMLPIVGEYDLLRREYEDLKREYEDLRRPFFASADTPYTDTWDFKTVNTYPGKHICEKPLELCQHIVRISSRPDALVLDPFCGSGNMLRAAFVEGRQFIGGDTDLQWATRARNRITLPYEVPLFQLDNVQEQPA